MRVGPPKTTQLATGEFEVQMTPEPPYDERNGVILGRASFDKTFKGVLQAKSSVQMLSARTPEPTSAGYVALERIEGTLDEKQGSFAAVHIGLMHGGENSLEIRIVPNSGTGELKGIVGSMAIVVAEGKHTYVLEYDFE